MKHWNIKVAGLVQGVNFRWETETRAKMLNLSGFVRNEPDGTVYIEVEGLEESLAKLVAWAKKGPWFAKVHRVEVEESDVKGYDDFKVVQ